MPVVWMPQMNFQQDPVRVMSKIILILLFSYCACRQVFLRLWNHALHHTLYISRDPVRYIS